VVGGGVRDLLLGAAPKDFDIATSATPEEVRSLFRNCRLIGRRFRLAHVYFGREIIEVATFRGPGNNDQKNHHSESGRILRDNVFGSAEEDARRRDFTINALYLDPVSLELRDYVGGYADLKSGVLKLIGDPETRFKEDPVRLLRAARFEAKLGLKLAKKTAGQMQGLGYLLDDMPPARLFEEINKMFLNGFAVPTLHALQKHGLMHHLFPGLPHDNGRINETRLLKEALINTDQRVREKKPVTPAFLYAVLLWQQVKRRSLELLEEGLSDNEALSIAGDEAVSRQVQVIAIPRRFSTVTRQIWALQPRFRWQKGRRAERLFRDRWFRAAYDFLLLRATEEPDLKPLADWWTELQTLDNEARQKALFDQQLRRRRRPRRRRRKQSPNLDNKRA